MKWSLRLGRFLGIDVFLHFTFLLFVAWLVFHAYGPMKNTALALSTLIFLITIFTCVVLHEYGHALMARRFGIPTRDITLLPIGGVARLERMPSNPKEELLVAVAGPAVNVVLALLAGLCMSLTKVLPYWDLPRIFSAGFLWQLLLVNLMMIGFNMLPAFPMDGGRVLRAFLAMRLPYARATRIAARIGKGMAVLFGLAALFVPNMGMLAFIAVFVWIGATNEAGDAEETALLSDLLVKDAMMTDYRLLGPNDTASHAARLIRDGWQADFPVVLDGRLVGLVTRQDVVHVYETGSPASSVESFMRRELPACLPHEHLSVALERLRDSDLPLMPVVESGLLRGLVTAENVVETLMFRKALSKRQKPAAV